MNKIFLRNIIITVLVLALVIGSIVSLKGGKLDNTAMVTIDVQMAGAGDEIASSASALLSGITEGTVAPGAVSGFVKNFMYSDAMVSTIMSVSYPLLYKVLEKLEMLEFADKMDLFPTGPQLAEKLKGLGYTCCDKDGTRKPLEDVLTAVGDNWEYMASKITGVDGSGSSSKALWNTIVWGVTGKDSFYKAMQDMAMGLRGVFEVCVQNKERVITINVIEFLLKTDAIPLDMDAATIYNASEKTGYELCLIKLFNMLGLRDGDYPTVEEVTGYTELGDIWKALLEPVILAVERTEQDAMPKLMDMLVNFAHAVDSGELVESMRSLRMDADFNPLASLAMGYKDGLLHNLGDSLIETIESMGIKISGSFNELIDSLLQMLFKEEAADMPDMDTKKLFTLATSETLPNGNIYYDADTQAVTSFMLEYILSVDTVDALLRNTDFADTDSAEKITGAVDTHGSAVVALLNAVLGALSGEAEKEGDAAADDASEAASE